MQPYKFNVVTDLQFGSTSKGLIATYLAYKHRPEIISTTNMANAGHCQSADTYIITERGLEQLGDVVSGKAAKTAINMNGKYETISNHYYDGVRKTNKIVLSNGIRLKCTSAHKYYVWDISNNCFEWVESNKLDVSNHIFLFPKEVNFASNNLLPHEFSLKQKPNRTIITLPPSTTDKSADVRFAEYLGLLVGDGYYAGVQKVQIAFHEDQLDVADAITQLYYDMGINSVKCEKVEGKKCYTLTVRQTSGLHELFKLVELPIAVKQYKKTPKRVMTSNKLVLSAYLRGLFDSDGSVKKDRIQLSNCAKSVVCDAQQMLYVLGIHSCLSTRQCKRPTKVGHRLKQYVLSISGLDDMAKFKSNINFLSSIKIQRLNKLVAETKGQGHILPINDPVKTKLRKVGLAGRQCTRTTAVIEKLSTATDTDLMKLYTLCEQYHPVKIKSIVLGYDHSEMFDITMPDSHSYIANGCVSHNTAVDVDGKAFVAKVLPSAAILKKWYPGYEPKIVIGPTAAFTIQQLFLELQETGTTSLMIHERAGVITDEHKNLESTATKHLASTMQGCGAYLADKVLRKEGLKLARDYTELASYIVRNDSETQQPLPAYLHTCMLLGYTILHEGAQGFSLDISHGHSYPTCTSRGTTAMTNMCDMGMNHRDVGDVYGVIRPYPIRVGNVIENGQTTGYSGGWYADQHELSWDEVSEACGAPQGSMKGELTTVTKRLRRVATFSKRQLRESVAVNGVTKIALNFANYIDWSCNRTTNLTPKVMDFVKEVEDCAGIKVALVSTGPQIDHVIEL